MLLFPYRINTKDNMNTYLRKLRQEVWMISAYLTKGESNDNSSQEISDGVVKIGVLRKTTSPFQ